MKSPEELEKKYGQSAVTKEAFVTVNRSEDPGKQSSMVQAPSRLWQQCSQQPRHRSSLGTAQRMNG